MMSVPAGGDLSKIATRLSKLSAGRRGIVDRFEWSEEPQYDRLAMPRSLVSLGSLPIYETLTDDIRWRLHLREMSRFFYLNIVGETELVQGIATLREGAEKGPVVEYLGHFEEEEIEHSAVFAEFCRRYGSGDDLVRQFKFPRSYAEGEKELLFFAQALIFEEIADFFNKAIVADAEVWSLTREINAYHTEDEARHMAFGRQMVFDLWERYEAGWSEGVREGIAQYLGNYALGTLRGLVEPSIYEDLGIVADSGAALELRQNVLDSTWFEELEKNALSRVRRAMLTLNIFDRRPVGGKAH